MAHNNAGDVNNVAIKAQESLAVKNDPPLSRGIGDVGATAPLHKQHRNWRVAGNLMGGGTGSGLMIAASALSLQDAPVGNWPLVALGLIGPGFFLVFLGRGRLPRAPLNTLLNLQTSWMTLEAITGLVLFSLGLISYFTGSANVFALAGVAGSVFLYCQARNLTGPTAIPAGGHIASLPLMLSTGVAEGIAVYLIAGPHLGQPENTMQPAITAMLVVLAVRAVAWRRYVGAMTGDAPPATSEALDAVHGLFHYGGNLFAMALCAIMLIWSDLDGPTMGVGVIVLVSGWVYKYSLITQMSSK